MQPPPVQYAMTEDGVRIAYTVSGQGPPLVLVTEPVVSHTQLEWSHPLFGRIYGRHPDRRTLVRFDARSTGLSQRGVERPVESGPIDLDAVVRRVGLERFSLVAVQGSTIPVIMWVAQHAEAVEKLVFIDGFARARDTANTPTSRALVAAARADFFLATEAIGAVALGAGRDEVRDYGAYIRQCIDSDYFGRPDEEAEDRLDRADVTALLPAITAPALVLHHHDLPYVTADMSRDLAARLPNAQYVELPGSWADDPEGVIDIVLDFLVGPEVEAPTAAPTAQARGHAVHAILFTDIERNTQILDRLGDAKWRELLREHERITRDLLNRHGGTEIKTIGDAFMASFSSPANALACAVELQRAFASRNASAAEPIVVRVGVNAGEPIAEASDLFGASVTMASRIAGTASGGEIVVANVVRELVAGKGFLFADRGDVVLRGFEDPVRLYEVRWRDGK